MRNYKDARIVIIGLGITGVSCVNFFLARGIIPKVIDTRFYPPGRSKIPSFVKCCFGLLREEWILNSTLLVISPGVRLDYPVLIEALELGIEIIGDVELFVREVTAPIIAITGSNGKSTVTQLVGNIARCAGLNVGIAGNIGIPVLTLLSRSYQLYILELSSFQLDTTYSLSATAAIILNISVDHMDRYSGRFQQYLLSKKKIYNNAISCIVNISDFLVAPIFYKCKNSISFGINQDNADYNLSFYRGNFWIVAYNEYLLNCSEMIVNNRIYYINALSALTLSDVIKVPRIISLTVLRRFCGLPHRCQLVYKNHNVSWVNDSKSTNVDSTRHAINNIAKLTVGKLHLLLGGDGKLADFSLLKNLIKKYNICLYCFGKDGLLLTELGTGSVICTYTMIQAMRIISLRVCPRDIVLLSPACSSKDQFVSFKIRGTVFNYFAQKFGS